MLNGQTGRSDDTTALSTLRDEIVRAEDTRSDLVKWKLALVGGIGAVGLGFAGSAGSNSTRKGADLVLCAIPLVCVYVDFCCAHLKQRILIIACFIRTREAAEMLVVYEKYVQTARHGSKWCLRFGAQKWRLGGVFAFEDLALEGATIFLSILVIVFPLLIHRRGVPGNPVFFVSGAIGLTLAALGWRLHDHLSRDLDEHDVNEAIRSGTWTTRRDSDSKAR